MTEPSNVIELGAIPSEFDLEDARISRYASVSMFEILRRESGKPNFPIEGVLCADGILLTGLEGSGKSWLADHMGWSLATQQPEWCGHKITVGRPLTVVVACTDIGGPAEYAYRWSLLGGAPNLRALSITVAVDWTALVGSLRRDGADVLIIDNLAGLLDHEDEGDIRSNEDAGKVIKGLYAVRNAGIIPILIAHTSDTGDQSWSKRQVRRHMGAKRYSQWARHVVTLNEVADDRRVLTVQKSNYVRAGEQTYLRFRPGQPELGSRIVELDPDGEKRAKDHQRKRAAERLDNNAEIARWVVANCQGKNQRQTAEAIVAQFGGSVSGRVTDLSKGRGYGAMLKQSGKGDKTVWSL